MSTNIEMTVNYRLDDKKAVKPLYPTLDLLVNSFIIHRLRSKHLTFHFDK